VWRYVVTKVPPVLGNDQERWVFEEMQTRARGPWHVLESRRGEFRDDMMKDIGMVEAILDGRDWILGEPSLADFGISEDYRRFSPWVRRFRRRSRATRAWASRIQSLG